jgi:hypothetical protein
MKTTEIIVDAKATLGENIRLTGMREVYAYVNGDRTDTLEGYKYEVVLLDKSFEKVEFKIENTTPLFTEQDVEQNIAVKAINPKISLYPNYRGGETGMNVSADKLVPVNE